MKGMFPGYEAITDEERKRAWESGTFVFDTNVLLDFYRYKKLTQDELFNVIEKIKDRIWIPYNVGLEFYRNRPTVIQEQNSKFQDTKKNISKQLGEIKDALIELDKKHTEISTTAFVAKLNGLSKEAEEFKEKNIQIYNHAEDQLEARIKNLFNQKIGDKPENQSKIDSLYKEAQKRFDLKIPPGYEDKDKKDSEFYFAGIIYKKQYGDFLNWRQTLDFAKEKRIKAIIFITNDNKEDWWWRVSGKTIGPRPELVSEAKNEGIEIFLMYSSENFLRYAKEFLEIEISEDTFNDILEESKIHDGYKSSILTETLFIPALKKWLNENESYTDFKDLDTKFDFSCTNMNNRTCFIETKKIGNNRTVNRDKKEGIFGLFTESLIIDHYNAKNKTNLMIQNTLNNFFEKCNHMKVQASFMLVMFSQEPFTSDIIIKTIEKVDALNPYKIQDIKVLLLTANKNEDGSFLIDKIAEI